MAPIRNSIVYRNDLPPSSSNTVPAEGLRPQEASSMAHTTTEHELEVMRRTLHKEKKRRASLESSLARFTEFSKYHAQRSKTLQEEIDKKVAEKRSRPRREKKEEVESSCNPSTDIGCDIVCKICRRSVANMVMLPCRHLGVCSACFQRTGVCPICGAEIFSSFKFTRFKSSTQKRK